MNRPSIFDEGNRQARKQSLIAAAVLFAGFCCYLLLVQ